LTKHLKKVGRERRKKAKREVPVIEARQPKPGRMEKARLLLGVRSSDGDKPSPTKEEIGNKEHNVGFVKKQQKKKQGSLILKREIMFAVPPKHWDVLENPYLDK